jgi:hypothetical protein
MVRTPRPAGVTERQSTTVGAQSPARVGSKAAALASAGVGRRSHVEIAKTLQALGYTGDVANDALAVKDGAPLHDAAVVTVYESGLVVPRSREPHSQDATCWVPSKVYGLAACSMVRAAWMAWLVARSPIVLTPMLLASAPASVAVMPLSASTRAMRSSAAVLPA